MRHEDLNKHDEPWAALSSLADGQANEAQQMECLALWPSRGDLRARWHEYQVIGDVLRSDELAADLTHDAAFLLSLRERLAREPTRLMPAAAQVRRTPAWLGPMAAVAGVGAVAATLTVLWPSTSGSGASATLAAALPASGSNPVTVNGPQMRTVSGQLIRDARLDRYLAAHRQGANGAALQMPGAVVRSVDTIALENR